MNSNAYLEQPLTRTVFILLHVPKMLKDIFDMLKATPSLRKHWCSCSKKIWKLFNNKVKGNGLSCCCNWNCRKSWKLLITFGFLYLNTHTKTRPNGNITQDKRCLEPILQYNDLFENPQCPVIGEHNNYKKLKRTSNHQELN